MTDTPRMTPAARMAVILFLAVYGLMIIRNPDQYRLIDNVDLAIHEAGHVFFSPFGEFIGFLGGTLLQLMIPVTFLVYFLRRGDRFAAAVVLWWVAQNLWNVSVYVKDARAQLLPLVGGGEHDWTYLLGTMGVLRRDQGVGTTIFVVGILLYSVSILVGFMNFASTPAARAQGRTGGVTSPAMHPPS